MPSRQAWMTVLSCAMAFAMVGFWGKKEEQKPAEDTTKQTEAVQAAMPQTSEELSVGQVIGIENQSGTVIHKFEGDEAMRDFAAMWQQRRGILTRVAVLRAYLTEEQARLDEMDTEFTDQYGLNSEQPVVLDSDRQVLIQLESEPEGLDGSGTMTN